MHCPSRRQANLRWEAQNTRTGGYSVVRRAWSSAAWDHHAYPQQAAHQPDRNTSRATNGEGKGARHPPADEQRRCQRRRQPAVYRFPRHPPVEWTCPHEQRPHSAPPTALSALTPLAESQTTADAAQVHIHKSDANQKQNIFKSRYTNRGNRKGWHTKEDGGGGLGLVAGYLQFPGPQNLPKTAAGTRYRRPECGGLA